jgi:hypothetical protein
LRSKTQCAAVKTCLLEISAPEQARPGVPEGAVAGAPPTSMPTAEKGKSSVSATGLLSDLNRGPAAGAAAAEAVCIAALAISRASSEMLVISWRRPRRGFPVVDVLRKASPERVTSKVREEEEEREEAEVGCGRGGGGGDEDEEEDAAWLLPASLEKVTVPIYSYAEQELVTDNTSHARRGNEGRLERNAEGHGRILFSWRLRKKRGGGQRRWATTMTSSSLFSRASHVLPLLVFLIPFNEVIKIELFSAQKR